MTLMILNAKIGFMDFWRFLAATHILKANCAEITTDRLVQPAYKIFDINVDLNGPSFNPVDLKCLRTRASKMGTP